MTLFSSLAVCSNTSWTSCHTWTLCLGKDISPSPHVISPVPWGPLIFAFLMPFTALCLVTYWCFSPIIIQLHELDARNFIEPKEHFLCMYNVILQDGASNQRVLRNHAFNPTATETCSHNGQVPPILGDSTVIIITLVVQSSYVAEQDKVFIPYPLCYQQIQMVVNFWQFHNGFSISIGDTITGPKVVTQHIGGKKQQVAGIIDNAYHD